ncbi:MAG: glycosyltransferase [Balneola sp.]|nr:MAG: glycosyltransferase [Balneola sp.]
MADALGLFLTISGLLYLLVLVFVASLGQIILHLRDRKRTEPEVWPTVSVLVSGKNEEAVFATCINSLINLDYPKEKLQIIIVDDQSTDNTAKVIETAIEGHDHVQTLNTKDYDTHLKAKARGISFAAKHATGEWLFITDADAEVHPLWLKKMLTGTSKKTGTIAGMMTIKENNLVSTLEKMSWGYTIPFAFGAAGYGMDFICVGPNMAIRRSIYEESGGLEKAEFNVAEDLAIFMMSANAGYKALAHNNPETTVRMFPLETFQQLLSQQRRWIRGGYEQSWEYSIGLSVVFGFGFLFVIAIILGLFINPVAATGALLLKLVAESSVFITEKIVFREKRFLRYLPVIYFYLFFIFLFLPISFVINRSVSWQGEGYKIDYK